MLGLTLITAIAFFGGIKADLINGSKKNKIIYLSAVFGAMFLFALLRGYSVGIDYEFRSWEMDLIVKRDFIGMMQYGTEQKEWLYYILIWLVGRIFPAPWVINGLMDAFILATFAWFFYRYSRDVTMASMMFVTFAFAAELNITRQYAAAACFLIALHLIIQDKPWHALIPLVAGALVHASAVLLFAFYFLFLRRMRTNRPELLLYLGLSVCLFVFFDPLLDLFLLIFPRYKFALRDKFIGNSGFSFKWLTVFMIIFVSLYLTTPKSRKNEKLPKATKAQKLNYAVALGFILYAALAMLRAKMWFVQRMMVYGMFGYCMIIPEVMPKLRLPETVCQWLRLPEDWKKWLCLGIKAALAVWALLEFRKDPHGLLPYVFLWQ